MNNQFIGACYFCKKSKLIVFSDSWKGKRLDDDSWFKGSWRNGCEACEKKFNLGINLKIKFNNQKGGIKNNMAKLSERAQNYVATGKLKNISELSSVSTDVDIQEKIFAEGTEKEFKAEVFTVDGEEYKMPLTVISSLNVILEENPALKTFKVKKSGSGIGTEYTVIPLS